MAVYIRTANDRFPRYSHMALFPVYYDAEESQVYFLVDVKERIFWIRPSRKRT